MKKNAGILLYRLIKKKPQVLIVHPGGPFWVNKDEGAWSIPKGEFTDDEDPLAAAKREFKEETGISITGNFFPLSPVRQGSGKTVYAYALELDLDIKSVTSNLFSIEWPPKSGKMREFPEIDRAEWVDIETCRVKINPYQWPLIDELLQNIS